ncbi:MAG TPA: hypothetical protein VIG68_06375 [Lysobacter sp.]
MPQPLIHSPEPSGTRHRVPHARGADALRYWEPRRIAYNAVLALVTAAVFAAHWPRFVERASLDLFLGLFLLAVLANVAYCAAYPADLFLQRSSPPHACRRARTTLFAVGTAFATVIAQFVARGIAGGA